MGIYSGDTELASLFLGDTQIQNVYSGDDLVWQNATHVMTVGSNATTIGFSVVSVFGSIDPTTVVISGVPQSWLVLQTNLNPGAISLDWSNSSSGDVWTSCTLTTSVGFKTVILKADCTYGSGQWRTNNQTYGATEIGADGTETKIVFV
jgi:hypothetical protein